MTLLTGMGLFVAYMIVGIVYNRLIVKIPYESDYWFIIHSARAIGMAAFPSIVVLLWPFDLLLMLMFVALSGFNWLIRKALGFKD